MIRLDSLLHHLWEFALLRVAITGLFTVSLYQAKSYYIDSLSQTLGIYLRWEKSPEKCLSKSETGHIKSNPSEETVFTTTTQEGRRKSAAWPVSSSRGYTQPQKCFVYTHSTYPSIHPSVNEELLYEPLRMDARASSAPFFQVK